MNRLKILLKQFFEEDDEQLEQKDFLAEFFRRIRTGV